MREAVALCTVVALLSSVSGCARVGAVLTVFTLCVESCGNKSNATGYFGASLSVMGDAAFLIAGPIMWGVGAGLEPKEACYETSARPAPPALEVRF